MGKPNQIRIGDLLIANNIISDQQLQNSLKNQKITGLKLGQQLVQDGYIKQSQLNAFLAKQLNIAYIDLHNFDLRKEIVQQIPELVCRRLRVIALGTGRDGSMVVGMADPTDIFGYDELTRVLGRQIRQAVVDEDVLLESIDRFFRKSQEMGGIAEELGNSTETADEKRADTFNVEDVVGDAPVVRFLQTMFEDAVQINASDIHIEPDEKKLQIRLRQDGVLHVQLTAEKRIATPLLSRLKLLANLDISEKRLPQDGRFNIQVLNQNIDVRLSTIPIQGGGESAVMRLLIQTGRVLNLDASGMPPPVLTHLREIIR
ncbi:MAG: ATPase, T2SS/T4P/T4SS family, partial [Gammaproteobacteria bacterium]|nr:ATPase, T2SS/T4P/T4SS family [Gammaproteobacteria bacterium]